MKIYFLSHIEGSHYILAILPQVVFFLRGMRLLDVAPEAGGEGFVANVAGPLAPVVPGLPAAQRLRHFLQLRGHRQVWHRSKGRRAEAQAHVGGGCCHVQEVVSHGEPGVETWRSGAEPLRRTAEGSDVGDGLVVVNAHVVECFQVVLRKNHSKEFF